MTAKRKVQRMPKIDIEDSVAKEFSDFPKEAKANKVLITSFVVIIETYDGQQKKLRMKKSKNLQDWAANGMLSWAQKGFMTESEDDDDFYNPEWYWEQ
jgi:hypothetical protein